MIKIIGDIFLLFVAIFVILYIFLLVRTGFLVICRKPNKWDFLHEFSKNIINDEGKKVKVYYRDDEKKNIKKLTLNILQFIGLVILVLIIIMVEYHITYDEIH